MNVDADDFVATPVAISRPPQVAVDTKVQGQGFYRCKWEVLSNTSDYQDAAESITLTEVGSTAGLALRIDEPARSRSYTHDAAWQGPLAKPVCTTGWPRRRRAQRTGSKDKGVQTDNYQLNIVNDKGGLDVYDLNQWAGRDSRSNTDHTNMQLRNRPPLAAGLADIARAAGPPLAAGLAEIVRAATAAAAMEEENGEMS